MRSKRKNHGFSLTEVLIAVGILMVGMLMVAGLFPVAIHLTAVSTERTIGAVVADEAFAKMRLYASEPTNRGIFFSALSDERPAIDFRDRNREGNLKIRLGSPNLI